ncbi:MAG: LamG domain-containing protein, partial [Elainella sp.]
VIATQPDSPARLSRLAALTQNLASFRQTVPPATRPDGPLSPQSINQVIKTEGLSSRVTPPSNPPAGLQVLYLFQGGSGRTVADVSGVGEPLNLDLTERASDGQAAHWQWEPDGLRLLRPSALIANRPATKLIAACRASNELSIEAWIELDAAQTRASRLLPIVTLSHDPNNRYFTLAQGSNSDQPGDGFTVRLRTEHITNSDGTRLDRSAPLASSGTAKPGLSHLLVTRRADGTLKFYLDGQERASSRVENSLFPVYSGQNTDQTFRLGLANEILGERPWLGKYYRVAVYSRALTEAEVRSQFAQGPFARPTVSAPTRPESPLPLPVGLQALYLFQGSGTRVADQAGAGAPLDLELTQSPNPDNGQGDFWRWQEDGLEIRRPAVLRSRQPATRLISACKASDELTLEVWVKPLRADQGEGNPARIVTLSAGTSYRNFSLQQGLWQPNGTTQNRYGVRLRTTTRQDQQDNLNGEPFLAAASVVPAPETVHLVYTRAADGAAKLYINGVEQASVTAGGSFDNWDDSFELRLANELTNDRPWLGTYHRVAIYSRALTAAEVRSQFGRGYSLSQIAPHPWSSTGLQFATSRLLSQISLQPSPAAPALTRFAAATLLPTLPATAQVQPQSLASSPYLGVMFQPALQPLADRYRQSLVSSELLCLDRATHSLRPVSSHFWELPDPNLSDAPIVSEAEIYANSLKIYANSLTWAKSLHARLCPESPVAVLRYREIRRLIAPSPSDPASLAPPEAEPAAMPPVAPIITTYSYQIVPVAIAELPLQRVFQLRSRPAQLRFSEGQWGGTRLPLSLQPFELAPPQTTGVQPLYLQSRPDDPTLWPWGLSALRVSVRHTPASVTGRLNPESNLENGSDNDPGSNSGSDRTLWWQAPQYSVQYRTAKSGVTAGLPALFRARAITSLLPTAPQPPLPTIAVSETFAAAADATANWQAILPSTMRYLLLGSRSGLFFNLRNQLLRQGQLTPQTLTSGSVFVSGSLPVQHRMPRPVPLPPNINPDLALQPWASFFQPRQTVWVADSPTDTAFLGANLLQNQPPRGLRLQLLVPQLGAVPPNWNGCLKFGLVNYRGTDPQLAQALDWQIGQVSALVGAQTFSFSQLAYDLQLLTSDAPLPEQGQARISLGKEGSAYRVRIFDSQGERVFDQSAVALPLPDRLAQSLNAAFENPGQDIRNIQAEIQRELVQAFTGSLEFKLFNGLQALMDRLALRGAGSTLNLQARVKPRPVAGHTDDGFEQSLSFTLRLTSDRTLPLPLQPRFLQFEDPEYNRQLASPTAHVSTQVAANLSSDPAAAAQLIGLRLAADRREYNPDSLLTWRYDWATNAAELDKLFTVRLLQIQRLRSGLPAPLVLPSSALLKTGTIYQIPLAQLTLPTSSSPTPAGSILQPGDVLQLTLSINKPDPAQPNLPVPTVRLVLTVAIVAEPVQPAPEAAYGLLRQNPDGSVECVRFAWSVLPNRVDLINPDDLKTEVVRRRALFQWTDTVRPHADIRYALQKITQTGSTACNPF